MFGNFAAKRNPGSVANVQARNMVQTAPKTSAL
jgi:hypothetical protein